MYCTVSYLARWERMHIGQQGSTAASQHLAGCMYVYYFLLHLEHSLTDSKMWCLQMNQGPDFRSKLKIATFDSMFENV